jgi:arsenate reductase (glutaredoxin)
MKTIFYLKTCSTCTKIIKELDLGQEFNYREIKSEPITLEELEMMFGKTGSYEALFSKTAMKYRALGLNEKNLQEEDFKKLILEEYTFLKRPVILVGENIFVGNAKKTIEEVKKLLNK